MNQTRAEEITMREDYGNITLDTGQYLIIYILYIYMYLISVLDLFFAFVCHNPDPVHQHKKRQK